MAMKQIQNPSNWKLAILLIPVVAMMLVVAFSRTLPIWAIVVAAVFFVSYLGALTYYCIKQKCYKQLISNIVILVWNIIFIILLFYVV